MSWETFVIELVKAVVDLLKAMSWPAVILIIALFFRSEIRRAIRVLAERLEKVKAGSLEANLSQRPVVEKLAGIEEAIEEE